MAKLSEVQQHFDRVDNKLAEVFRKSGLEEIKESYPEEYFVHLCREIVGQQLSTKVARVIWGRFESLFEQSHLVPENLLKLQSQAIRDLGIAWSKVNAMFDLANKIVDKTLVFSDYPNMPDAEIMTNLQLVKGIGPWTTEMFLIFTMGREDVFSIKDLGLRNAVVKLYELKPTKTLEKKILKLANNWAPYRSYASLTLWHFLDNKPNS